jgi:hypothetical protein
LYSLGRIAQEQMCSCRREARTTFFLTLRSAVVALNVALLVNVMKKNQEKGFVIRISLFS